MKQTNKNQSEMQADQEKNNGNMEVKVKAGFFRNIVVKTKKKTRITTNKPVENVIAIIKKYLLNFSNQDKGNEWEIGK